MLATSDAIDLLRLTIGDRSDARIQFAHSYIGMGLTPIVAIDLERGGKGSFREIVSVIRTFARFGSGRSPSNVFKYLTAHHGIDWLCHYDTPRGRLSSMRIPASRHRRWRQAMMTQGRQDLTLHPWTPLLCSATR